MDNAELLKAHKRLEWRELARRLEERIMGWLKEIVPGLDLIETPFYVVFDSLAHAIMLLQRKSSISNLDCVTQYDYHTATCFCDHLYMNLRFSDNALRALIHAILNKNHPITFEILADFNALRKEKKDEGDEEAHGPRPSPDEHFLGMIKTVKSRVFDGKEDNPLCKKLTEWADGYVKKWPQNSPTKMQQRRKSRASLSASKAPPPPQSEDRPGTPTLESEPGEISDEAEDSKLPADSVGRTFNVIQCKKLATSESSTDAARLLQSRSSAPVPASQGGASPSTLRQTIDDNRGGSKGAPFSGGKGSQQHNSSGRKGSSRKSKTQASAQARRAPSSPPSNEQQGLPEEQELTPKPVKWSLSLKFTPTPEGRAANSSVTRRNSYPNSGSDRKRRHSNERDKQPPCKRSKDRRY